MKTLWRWSLSCQWSTVNDINAKFRRHVETTLLFLLSTRLPPYQPTSPTTPSPTLGRRHFTPRISSSSSSTHLALFLLLSSRFLPLYRVANFTVSARVDQRNSAIRSFISFKKIFPYFNEKSFSFSVGQSLLLVQHPPPFLTSSFFNPLFWILLIFFYKYHLHFVPPFLRVLGTKWRENLRDAVFFNGRKKRKDFLQVESNCEFCKTMMYRIQIAPFLCTPSAKKVKVTRNNLQWNFLMLFEHTFASIFLFFILLPLLLFPSLCIFPSHVSSLLYFYREHGWK